MATASIQPSAMSASTMTSGSTASTSWSSTSVRNSIVAGYAAGITGTLVGHPLDSAKVWLQTQQTHSRSTAASRSATTPRIISSTKVTNATNARTMSTLAANLTNTTGGITGTTSASSLISRYASTLRSLYKGIGGPLVTVGMVQSINFAVYDSCRRMLYNLDHPQGGQVGNYLQNDSLYNVAASSMVAGSILACFTSPMLIVKTQQQVHGHSFRRAVQEMIRPDKAAPLQFRNMFVGFGVHSFSEIIGRAVYFVAYEHLKRSLFQYRQIQDPDILVVNLSDRMASAAVSGVLCWAAIFPIDAVRCRLYAERPSVHSRLTAVQMARQMWGQAGWRAFYRGFGVTVLRAGPVAAAVLPVYDLTLETLSSMD